MKGCTYLLWRRKGKLPPLWGLPFVRQAATKGVYHTILKGGPTGELKILLQQPNITILRGKPNTPFTWNMTEEQKKEGHCISNTAIKTSHTPCTKNSQCDLLIFRRNYGKL